MSRKPLLLMAVEGEECSAITVPSNFSDVQAGSEIAGTVSKVLIFNAISCVQYILLFYVFAFRC